MLPINQATRIYVSTVPVDFRKGIDGLCGFVREVFRENPFDGAIFVFRNKNGESIRILCYDGQGYWLCQKRLSKGKFRNWPKDRNGEKLCIQSSELAVLVCGGDFQKVKPLPLWRKPA